MSRPADIHDLLGHADWLRRLAGHLVRDDEDRDDLVQQTWLAALRAPPAADRPPRPWLAQVLRNFVRRGFRDRRSRRVREAIGTAAGAAAIGSAAQSPEALLAGAELQRVVAELVVALAEPYRTTVVLRYFQGVEPAEIARSMGVPAGTVRWRVNEAIRRLRAALDARDGAEARDWRQALLPLAGAGAPSPALKGGLLIMSTKAKMGVVAVVVALLVAGSWTWNRRRDAASATTAPVMAMASGDKPTSGRADPRRAAPGAAASSAAAPGVAGRNESRRFSTGRARSAPPKLLAAPAAPAPAAAVPPPASRVGSLDKDQIRRAMRRIIPAMTDCYNKLLDDEPRAVGRLEFHFTIKDVGGVGRISDATILPKGTDDGTPELIAPLTEQCMLNAIGEASFPAPEGGDVVVTYPFTFAPDGDLIPGSPQAAPRPSPTTAR
jgi:RNA polymerase sigma factor (sigma-70 family)